MKNKIFGILGVFVIPFFLFIFFSLVTPGFGLHSLPIIISQSMIPTMIGFGMCVMFLCGLMDFSVGCRVIFAGVAGAALAQYWGLVGFIIGCIGGSLVSALLVAYLYRYLKIPSMVVSLGFVLIGEALSYSGAELFGFTSLIHIPPSVSVWFAFPYNILWVTGAGIVFYLLLYHTKIGFHIIAVGEDELLAKNMGVIPQNVKTIAYLLSGVFIAIAAFLQTSYAGFLSVTLGGGTMAMVFKPIMGVMIGLTLIRLWNNSPVLIILGEICLTIIFNGLIAAGLPDVFQSIVLGLFLLTILGISGNTEKFRESIRRSHVRKMDPAGY